MVIVADSLRYCRKRVRESEPCFIVNKRARITSRPMHKQSTAILSRKNLKRKRSDAAFQAAKKQRIDQNQQVYNFATEVFTMPFESEIVSKSGKRCQNNIPNLLN